MIGIERNCSRKVSSGGREQCGRSRLKETRRRCRTAGQIHGRAQPARGVLFYDGKYKVVKNIADSRTHSAGDEHVIELAGCSVTKCPQQTDKAHFAFLVTTPQVNQRARVVASDACWS